MKLLKEHEERKASGKPFTDEEYAEADAEDKAKMDDYAEFCAYLAERDARKKKNWMKMAISLTKWKLYAPFSVSLFTAPSK